MYTMKNSASDGNNNDKIAAARHKVHAYISMVFREKACTIDVYLNNTNAN